MKLEIYHNKKTICQNFAFVERSSHLRMERKEKKIARELCGL